MTTTLRQITIASKTYDADVVEAAQQEADWTKLDAIGESEWYDVDWDESAEAGTLGAYRLSLGPQWSLFVGTDGSYITDVRVDSGDLLSYVYDWDYDSDRDEALAAWGLGYAPAAAPAGHDGPCRVWCEPNYYAGHINPPLPHYIRGRDDDGLTSWEDEPLVFATRAEAQEYVDRYYNAPSAYDGIPGCNVLSHGQAGPNQLTIVAAN